VNVFNRIVVIVLVLILIILVAIVVLVPRESLRTAAVTFDWLQQGTSDLLQNDRLLFAAGRVTIGGLAVILALILIWLEIRRPRKKSIRAQKMAGGEAQIATESIEQRLAYNIDQLPDVVHVYPKITGRSRGVDVDMVLETSPEIDVPMKTEEVLQVTREVVVERMGLKLGKVNVKIKHAPYPKE
jgi:hypothetical protein